MSSLFANGYYTESDLAIEGFRHLGTNVRIAKSCTIVGAPNISIASNVRIDAYTAIIAGGKETVEIGSYVHIGTCCLLIGKDGITLEDFCNLSHGVKIFSRSNDVSGKYMINTLVPEAYTRVDSGRVRVCRHAALLALSVVLPRVTVREGAVVGAHSLVSRSLPSWGVYSGQPLRRIRDRSKELLRFEEALLASADLKEEEAPS